MNTSTIETPTVFTVKTTRGQLVSLFGQPEVTRHRPYGVMDGPETETLSRWTVNTPYGEAAVTSWTSDAPDHYSVHGPRAAARYAEGRITGQIKLNHEVVLPKIARRIHSGQITIEEALRLAYREGLKLGDSAGQQLAADEMAEDIGNAFSELREEQESATSLDQAAAFDSAIGIVSAHTGVSPRPDTD